MKALIKLFAIVCPLCLALSARAEPSAFDLVGRWEGLVEFGKFKFRMIVKVAKTTDGKIEGKIDIPDQGAKDLPINALLYSYPDLRWEIDQIDTAFNGKLNDSGNEISGAFEEGPGGRPVPLVFKRTAEKAEPTRSYTFAAGEPQDMRGYWEGLVEAQPGTTSRVGLKIGRAPDATYAVELDLFDQGASNLAATTVAYTNSTARFEWQLFHVIYEAKLSDDGAHLTGDWQQRGKTNKVTFQRRARPATALPENVSFTPQEGKPDDLRGQWQGTLQVPDRKLRLVLRIGQAPDGSMVGTLASPDQGGGELPISTFGYTNPVVRLEWKGIHGVFQGKLNPEGALLDGTWEQGGPPLELKLARAPVPTEEKPSSTTKTP